MAATPEHVLTLFLVAGASILVGYVGHLLFRRHRFSDVLLLLGLGVAAGPFLGVVDGDLVRPMLGVLAPFGLVLVLFEGGLSLAWDELRHVAGRAVVATLGTWLLTAGALWLVAHPLLGLAPTLALLLAVALAGPGVTVLLPLLPDIAPPPAAKAFITIETSMGSLLNAVTTAAVVAVLLADASAWGGAGLVGARFLVGASAGLVAGVAWSRVLHLLHGQGHNYALTLGALLAAYVGTEVIGGSGFLMAVAFGLVVGNARALERDGGLRALSGFAPDMRLHQTEIIFLFRSVYFVFMGLTVSASAFRADYALGGLVLAGAVLAVRFVTMGATRAAGPAQAPSTTVLFVALMPRGLGTAIVASIPMTMGVAGAESLLPYVFFVIVFASVVTMVGLRLYERGRRAAERAAVVQGVPMAR